MLTAITVVVVLVIAWFLLVTLVKGFRDGLKIVEWLAVLVWVLTELCGCLWLKPAISLTAIKILITCLGGFCGLVLIAFTAASFSNEKANGTGIDTMGVASACYYLGTMLLCGAWFLTL